MHINVDHPAPRSEPARSLLLQLRDLIPTEDLTLAELFDLVDRLARQLRIIAGVDTEHLPLAVIADEPVFRLDLTELPLAGFSYWDPHTRQWVIALNEDESEAMHRFTVFHEVGHIAWHGFESRLFPRMAPINRDRLAEHEADVFAREATMPRARVEQAFRDGEHDPVILARRFKVSTNIMRWRLAQMDLPMVLPRDRSAYTFQHSILPRLPLLIDAA